MEALALHATTVVTEHPDATCHFVGFADDPESPSCYLLLQRDLETTQGSEPPDEPHLEWCDQHASGYGLIDRADLGPRKLDVTLNVKGAAALGGVTLLRISFDLGSETYNQLHSALDAIFRGTGALHVAAA